MPNCTAGRAGCMNEGARAAKGELLVFLHADTQLPPGWAESVRHALVAPQVAVAAFALSLHPRVPMLAFIEWGANMRSRYRQLPYGDQALCMRREVFDALGGFPKQPFLEDIDLVCEARRRGAVRLMAPKVVSSSRRYVMYGVLGNWCARASKPCPGTARTSPPPFVRSSGINVCVLFDPCLAGSTTRSSYSAVSLACPTSQWQNGIMEREAKKRIEMFVSDHQKTK